MQHGGILTSPTRVIAGEVPEAFVPLSGGRSIPVDMRGPLGGGTNLDVHIHNEGREKLEISSVQEYMVSDRRIIEVWMREAQTNLKVKRSIQQAAR